MSNTRSNKINPKEVLLYLNELGYTNVTAQQLKEFLTDLKKLIKYEYRHGRSSNCLDTLSSPLNENTEDILDLKNLTSDTFKKQDQDHIFHALHNHHTVSSRSRTINAKEKHISVHISKPRHTKIHEHCIHIEKTSSNEGETCTTVDHSEPRLEKQNKLESSKTELGTMTTANTIDNQSASKQSASSATVASKSESKSKKLKSAVIRKSSSQSFNKCDPVALYHQYKAEWKKIKLPGEDYHSDLRWAVREKLMNGPTVQVPVRRSSSKKSFHSFN